MWDILRWHNDTLSIAWWALIAFALLVIIAAGARAAKEAAATPSTMQHDSRRGFRIGGGEELAEGEPVVQGESAFFLLRPFRR
jgi:hypothetical protein